MKTFCTYYNENTCRSCSNLELDYAQQIKLKEEVLLSNISGLNQSLLLPSVLSKTESFRNKAKLIVTGTFADPIIGLAGEENLDMGRQILNCPVHHPAINSLLNILPDFITQTKLEPYRIADRKGELKGIIVFYSEHSQEMYLRFVLRSQESISRLIKHKDLLIKKMPQLQCLSANIQPIPHALLEGEEEIIISEKNHIQHLLTDKLLFLGPRGFVQTNQNIAEKLYITASKWVEETGLKNFTELFSGQGAFSFFVAPYIHRGLGIEINAEATASAKETAKRLKMGQLDFICADAEKIEDKLKAFNPDIVLVNPPRKGLGKGVEYFKTGDYPYLIYSSCSYESLATDLEQLKDSYTIVKAQIFDMFPHTNHFETLVLLKSSIFDKR